MKRTCLAGYFGILAGCLVLAWFTWVREPKAPRDEVTVFPCDKGGIVNLAYADEARTVTFTKRKDPYSDGSSWWVEVVRPAAPTAADAHGKKTTGAPDEADARAGSPSGGGAPTREIFKANDRLRDELDKFCPWKAVRALGRPAKEKRAEFGMTESAGSLTIGVVAGSHTFRLGGETFGPRDRYVADDETGEVFLVAGPPLRALQRPGSRFMERSLHAFKAKEVARIRLQADGREKELVRLASGEGGGTGWADSRSPEDAKVLYRNWIRRLSTLRATGYVGFPEGGEGGGCSAPADASQALSLTCFGTGGEIGFLRLYKGADDKGEAVYYACSENTEAVVKIPRTQAETILEDLEDVLSD